MFRTSVTKLFLGGGIAIIAGAILATTAVWIAIANDVFIMRGPDIVGLQGGAIAWSLVGTGIVGGLVVVAGLIAGFVAWIGALLTTWQLESKAWFVTLLLLGIFNLGFLAMIAYLIARPTTAESRERPALTGAGA